MNARNLFAISLLIIALSIAYYFIIFLPGKEKAKQEMDYKIEQQKLLLEEEKKATYDKCATEAKEGAKSLLKSKSELPGGYIYNEAVNKGLFLKDDYDYSYKDCLRKNGIVQ